jgi:tetratricopeptide (TPR) repeat protein
LSGNLSAPEVPLTPSTELTARDREELAEIVALVANSRNQGCVYFGICSNRLKIASLEAALDRDLRVHGIATARVVLAESHHGNGELAYSVLIADPITYFADNPPAKPTLFLVHGLPELIRAETAGDVSGPAPVSQRLNYGRELFRRQAICALFWIGPETTRYLAERSRDFWSFRSGTAQFQGEAGELGLRQESRGEWQDASGLRWLGDLQEKLDQLAVYQSKSPPDESAIAGLLLDIGRLRVERYEVQSGLEALHEAEDTFERLSNRRQLRNAKAWLARAYQRSGRLNKAEEFIRAAVALDTELHNDQSLAIDYNDLSQIYQDRGELGEAEQWLRKAIAIDERLGNEPQLAIRYSNLSQIYDARGELGEAEQWLRKAIAIDERLGNEPNLAILYNNLSLIYKARGELGEAEQWLRKAITIDERLNDEPNLAIDYNNLSQIYKDRGELGEAEQWLRKAIAIDERLDDQPNLAIDYNNLSQIYKDRGELGEAEQWLRKAIAIDERLGNEPQLAIGYSNLSQIYKARGELAQAEHWLRKALTLAEAKGSAETLAAIKGNLEALQERQTARK